PWWWDGRLSSRHPRLAATPEGRSGGVRQARRDVPAHRLYPDEGPPRILGALSPGGHPGRRVRPEGRGRRLRLPEDRGAARRHRRPAVQGRPVPDEEEQDRGRPWQGT